MTHPAEQPNPSSLEDDDYVLMPTEPAEADEPTAASTDPRTEWAPRAENPTNAWWADLRREQDELAE